MCPVCLLEIAAQLIYRCLCHHSSTLYLNLYQNHFFSKILTNTPSLTAVLNAENYGNVGMLHRHERTCEAKVQYMFPGGAYKTPLTSFQLLEDEGFTIPTELKYFPYRATFDFE